MINKKMAMVMMRETGFKAGDIVEYKSGRNRIHPKVLMVKPNGDLILLTRDIKMRIVGYKHNHGKGLTPYPYQRLCKNVCVKSSKVKLIKRIV